MSTAGVLLGLLVLGNPFSALLTGVGILALAGIVVNNNIILIDTFQPSVSFASRTGQQNPDREGQPHRD